MMTLLAHPIGRLRVTGMVEGASFLLLLGIAMPLKYMFGMPEYVRAVGSLHGALWLVYVGVLFETWRSQRWGMRRVIIAFVASIVPFGPFLLDSRLRAEQMRSLRAAG